MTRWTPVLLPLLACGGSGLSPGTLPGGTPAGSTAVGGPTGSTAAGLPSPGAPAGPATGIPPGSGTPAGAATGSATGTAPWRHTATVDGDPSEYGPGETFPLDGGTAWITWDDDALYVAVQHPDVGASPQHWLLIYLGDGATGATTGVQHNTQQPALTVPAQVLVRWKSDDSFDSRLDWSGGAWQDRPGWLGTEGSVRALDLATDTVELKLPLVPLGLGDVVSLHLCWIYEGSGYESSYAPSPPGSFLSGSYDPDYTQAWVFDRRAPDPPASTPPSP